MIRSINIGGLLLAVALVTVGQATARAEISGDYLETRTCDVYTGPCFANAQVGLTGQQAILAWSIDEGEYRGVDLSGLKVVMTVRAADTLGFGGGVVIHPDPIKSVILVDVNATAKQREALAQFARERAGKVGGEVVRVAAVPIEMKTDHVDMVGELKAGKEVSLVTRKLGHGDCVCTNEATFYPPLTKVENAEAAYTVDAGFSGRGLGAKWTNPGTRSAFLATFAK